MRMTSLTATVLVGVVLVCATAFGGGSEDSPFKLSFGVGADFTDNRDSVADGDSNVDLYFRPRVDAVYRGECMMFDGYYQPSYRYRQDPNALQNDSELLHSLGLNIGLNPSPLVEMRLNEQFSYTDDPALSEGGVRVRPNATYTANKLEGSAGVQVAPLSKMSVQGSHYIKRYEDDAVAAESDEGNISANVTFMRQVAPKTAVVLFGGVSAYDYQPGMNMLERDFVSGTLGVGAEKVFSPELSGSVRLGYMTADFDDTSLGSINAPYVSAGLTVSQAGSARITGNVSHLLRNSDVYPFASQESTELHGKAEWDVRKEVTVGVLMTYRLSSYEVDMRPAFAPDTGYSVSGDETVVVAGAEMGYWLSDRTQLKLGYQFENVDSDVDESFDRNTASLTLSRRL